MLTSISNFKIRLFGNPKKKKDKYPAVFEVFLQKRVEGSWHSTAATKIVQSCLDPTLFYSCWLL